MKNPLLWPWERGEKPFFINQEGFEWYLDDITTSWAQRENYGISLPNIIGVLIKKDDNIEGRVLMNKTTNEIVYESSSLESLGSHIDMLKITKSFKHGSSK